MAAPAVGLIASFTAAVANFFNWVLHRSQLKNTKEMQDAAKAQHAIQVQNNIEQTVANKNVDETRKILAE